MVISVVLWRSNVEAVKAAMVDGGGLDHVTSDDISKTAQASWACLDTFVGELPF